MTNLTTPRDPPETSTATAAAASSPITVTGEEMADAAAQAKHVSP